MGAELLSTQQMYDADRRTIEQGTSGEELMEEAGKACAEEVIRRWDLCNTAVLCGPGNNGGDGFVIARHLKRAGWPVSVFMFGAPESLSGDAAAMARLWDDPIQDLSRFDLTMSELIVDAVFGAGLTRDISGDLRTLFDRINASDVPVLSVDLPSGVNGDTGEILGTCLLADATVTFARKKLGHALMPGCSVCGEVEVVDIGIPDKVIEEIAPTVQENVPAVWLDNFPSTHPTQHKYDKGHALAISGGALNTGAIRLSARGALRVGAGLVTVACPSSAAIVHAHHLTAIMVKSFADTGGLREILTDRRKNALVFGPGAGVGSETREIVSILCQIERPLVLDADALTSFEHDPSAFFAVLHDKVVLTPHEGEFARLFGAGGDQNKCLRAVQAAQSCGAIVTLKGPDTVIAHPDGRCLVNTNAPPFLATAGSGDVLAGLICGLMAQGVPAFEATGAAVWLHGAAAARCGRGLIAEDLPEALPQILQAFEEPT